MGAARWQLFNLSMRRALLPELLSLARAVCYCYAAGVGLFGGCKVICPNGNLQADILLMLKSRIPPGEIRGMF